jgi:hypothetical protein
MDNTKILTYQQKKDFEGFLLSDNQEISKISWHGNKISLATIQETMSFFVWQFQTYGTESQLRLLRNNSTGEFKFIPFYQHIETGLQSNEIKESIENNNLTEYYLKNNYHFFGSIHHHCTSGAFQSSTDYRDEININGFHFTIGNLDKKQFSLHGRFVFRSVCYEINLLEIFDNLDFLNSENIPESIFPFQWLERLKEKPKPIISEITKMQTLSKSEATNEFKYSDFNDYNSYDYFQDFEKELEEIENTFFDSKVDSEYLYFLKLSDNQNKNKILELIDLLEYINLYNPIQENFELIEFLETIEGCTTLDLQKIKKLLGEK